MRFNFWTVIAFVLYIAAFGSFDSAVRHHSDGAGMTGVMLLIVAILLQLFTHESPADHLADYEFMDELGVHHEHDDERDPVAGSRAALVDLLRTTAERIRLVPGRATTDFAIEMLDLIAAIRRIYASETQYKQFVDAELQRPDVSGAAEPDDAGIFDRNADFFADPAAWCATHPLPEPEDAQPHRFAADAGIL